MTESQPTTIKFRDQEVTLKYPLYALNKLDDMGVNLGELGEGGLSTTALTKVVTAGLMCQFPDATVDEVAMSYDASDLETLGQAITEAFNKSKGK